jgi:hypothetical protein
MSDLSLLLESLGSILGLLKSLKILALLIKNRFLDGSAGDLKEALLQPGQAEAAGLPAGHEAMEQLIAHEQDSLRTLRRRQEVEEKGLEDVLFQEGGSPFLYHSLRIRHKLNNKQISKPFRFVTFLSIFHAKCLPGPCWPFLLLPS